MNQELLNFIAKAKRQGYASATSKFEDTDDNGKVCVFKEGPFTYRDKYFGGSTDCGQERVYLNGKVIWMMAYRGGMLAMQELSEQAFNFLKKCISKTPKEFPMRGPKSMKEGKFRYENIWKGNPEDFVGEENIYYNNKKICFRNYFGGLVKD